MKNLPVILLLILCVIFGAGWFFSARAHSATQAALEALGDEKAQVELQLEGFETAYAQVTKGFLAKDSAQQQLQQELEDAQSRRIGRVEIVTETRVDTVQTAVANADGTFFYADIDHDPMSGRISFDLPAVEFRYSLLFEPRLEQYIVQSASDRLLIGVRPLSPGTIVRVEAFDVTPYLREEGGWKLPWWTAPVAFVTGALTWEFAR